MNRRGLFRWGLIAVLLVAPAARGMASDDTAWAGAFIQRVGNQIAAIVAAPGSLDARKHRLAGLIDRVVDVRNAARFCLGRFWRQASAQQQQDYVGLFHDVLMRSILSRINSEPRHEAGVQVSVGHPERRDDSVYVPTVIQRNGAPPFNVTWVVDTDAADPRIIDVIAAGTSLRITIRDDYAAFLHRHDESIDALLQALRAQACDNCTGTGGVRD